MSSRTYDQKCARLIQRLYRQIGAAPSYQGILRIVRNDMAASPEQVPCEVRASRLFAQMRERRP